MAKQKIVVKEFIADFRSGMDDSDLREKYALTRRQLDKTLEKLVRLGKLDLTDFDDEGMTFEPTMELAGTCPNCGALMLADTPHCPICEVTVHEGEPSTGPKGSLPTVEPPPPPDPKTVIQKIRKEVSAFKPTETLTEGATSREENLSGASPMDECAEAPSPSKRRVSPVLAAACLALLLVLVAAGAAIFTNVIQLETLWPEPPVVKREVPLRPSTRPKAAPDRVAKTQQPAPPAEQVRPAEDAPTSARAAAEPDSPPAPPSPPAVPEPSKTEPAKPAESPLSESPEAVGTRAPVVSEQPVEEALPSAETEPRVAVREPSGTTGTENVPQAGAKREIPRSSEAPAETEPPTETAKLEPESPRVEAVESPDVEQVPIGETEDEPPAANTSEIVSAAPPKAEIPRFPSREAEAPQPESHEQKGVPSDTRQPSSAEAPTPLARPVAQEERPERAASLDGKTGARALIEAARHGDVDRIESLIARGADVNAVDESGNTALMVAAGSGRIEAVQALMRHGADVSVKNKKGISALGWAYNPLPGDYVPLRVRRRIVQLLKGGR